MSDLVINDHQQLSYFNRVDRGGEARTREGGADGVPGEEAGRQEGEENGSSAEGTGGTGVVVMAMCWLIRCIHEWHTSTVNEWVGHITLLSSVPPTPHIP